MQAILVLALACAVAVLGYAIGCFLQERAPVTPTHLDVADW